MKGASGALAAAAALLLCCSVSTRAEQDAAMDHNTDRFEANGHKTRTLDPLGGGHLIREVRESRPASWMPYMIARRFDYPTGKRELWPNIYSAYYGDGLPKRNFDEIDSMLPPIHGTPESYVDAHSCFGFARDSIRSGLDTFVKKRNFDEIDQTSMPFSFAKRFVHMYGRNYIDLPDSSFDKKRTRGDYPMDEIDLSHFPIGSKRSFDGSR